MPLVTRSTVLRAAGVASVAALLLTAAQTGASAAPVGTENAKSPVTHAAPGLLAAGGPAIPGNAGGAAGNATPTPHAALPDCTVTGGLGRGDSLVRPGFSPLADDDAPCAAVSLGIPPGGTDTSYSGLGTYLVLQSDGNLVEYETSTGAVLFNTATRTGATLTYQQDGNVVLYSDAGKALWQSGTSGDTQGVFFGPYGNGNLLVQAQSGDVVKLLGKAVTAGPGVVNFAASSPNGQYLVRVQADGNVVAYNGKTGKAFWSTGSAGKGKVRFAAQADGNLVLYAYPSNKVLWQTRTSDKTAFAYYQFDMQNDGNVVLYRTDGVARVKAVWSSRTHG